MAGPERIVLGMALLRILAGCIELAAAALMLRFNEVEAAFRINALLGLIGPLIFLTVSSLGLVGLAASMSAGSILLVLLGVALIFLAVR